MQEGRACIVLLSVAAAAALPQTSEAVHVKVHTPHLRWSQKVAETQDATQAQDV